MEGYNMYRISHSPTKHNLTTIEAVQLTSFGRQTNHQCVTIVNIHHIAFTRATAVWTGNFYCYHEHYHVGARPL